MILLVSGIVVLCVLPLSALVYYNNKNLILEKTLDVCKTIANNITKIADDELLLGDTYEATSSALTKLKDSGVSALKDTYVIDLDGSVVAQLYSNEPKKNLEKETILYFQNLTELTSREITLGDKDILQFVYPIFIEYQSQKLRAGTAILEFDSDQIFLPIQKLRYSILVSASILLLIGIGIAFFISYTLSYPLQTLNEGAKLIGTGEFSHRINLDGKDEIGQLALAFNQMTEKIQDFTNHLEQKVLDRTNELNQSLEQVKALKEAQDGDYYLTSLLIEPLSANNNYAKNVKTEFYLDQKKKFSFRNWDSQIGGDICITDTLRLHNREYTIFLNADAMGKSIQGAGGALVLGVVFNANLIRSRLISHSSIYPEIWLKERFIDLQNVFLSFDGTMYISVCMGLVDNESGMMYYINAEHPWTVLYRDGVASFLENKVELYKIGTPGQEDRFSVKTFQLKPGDVIITGSDGRDDIIIGNEENYDLINEDDSLFLKHVKNGKSDLSKIVREIKNTGKIYDDLSILRISFKENQEENIENEPVYKPQDLNDLINKFMEKGTPQKALDYLLEYSNLNPMDDDALYHLAKVYLLLKKFKFAQEFSERLYLRNKQHLKNLLIYSQILFELKFFSKVRLILEQVLDRDPGNKEAQKLLKRLQEKEDDTVEFAELNVGEISRKSPEEQKEELILISERLLKLKKWQDVLPYLKKALVFSNRDPLIQSKIGLVYYQMGDFAKAKDHWKIALEIEPSNQTIQSHLERLKISEKKNEKSK